MTGASAQGKSNSTPQAKDDLIEASEDGYLFTVADLLQNDLGGNAKKFWSFGLEFSSSPSQSGDVIYTTQGARLTLVVDDLTGSLGFVYDPSDVVLIQALVEGEQLTDSFTYTIRMANGTFSTATVSILVTGTNDPALIFHGTDDVLSVKEDMFLTAGGNLQIFDVDANESFFQPVTAPEEGTNGSYGTFTLSTDGAWTYQLNNGLADVQALNEGQTLTDSIVIYSADNTPFVINVSIEGTNEVQSTPVTLVASGWVIDDYYKAGSFETGDDPVDGPFYIDYVDLYNDTMPDRVAPSRSVITYSFAQAGQEYDPSFTQDFSRVSDGRGIIEFDISGNSLQGLQAVVLSFTPWSQIKLPEGYDQFDFYVYAGDGELGLDDWGAGTFAGSISLAPDSLGVLQEVYLDVDAVTSVLEPEEGSILGIAIRAHTVPEMDSGIETLFSFDAWASTVDFAYL